MKTYFSIKFANVTTNRDVITKASINAATADSNVWNSAVGTIPVHLMFEESKVGESPMIMSVQKRCQHKSNVRINIPTRQQEMQEENSS